MPLNEPIFVGIVPTSKAKTIIYAILHRDLQLISLESGSSENVIALLNEKENSIVAICGPQQPNTGLMSNESFRQSLSPSPRSDTWGNTRLAEYQMYQHKIRIPQTRHQADDCPGWMQTCFELFTQLKESGCKHYPQPDGSHQILETNAFAIFAVLLDTLPFTKSSLEGRLQRQLILYDLGLDIPDPMRVFEEITRFRLMQSRLDLVGLHTPQELDALVAAYTAWMAATRPKNVTFVGNDTEGQIVLPVSGLKKVYA